jgi:hypothetical protein
MNHKINSLGIPRESNSTHLGIMRFGNPVYGSVA